MTDKLIEQIKADRDPQNPLSVRDQLLLWMHDEDNESFPDYDDLAEFVDHYDEAAARILADAEVIEAARELATLLERVPSALNGAFSAGVEEREGGSARRQDKYLQGPESLRREIPAALTAFKEAMKKREDG